jgi:hypothetical protein
MAILCLAALFLGVTASGQILKSSEVKKLTASAKTAADHMKLAKHYEAVAAKHEADAKEHEALAEYYAKHPTGQEQKRPLSGHTAEHCRHYAEHCHRAAAAAKEMAAAHTEMAKQEAK